MTEMTGRPSTRLEPSTTWTVVTDSPLKGLSFAREAGTILAWDEGNQLYLLNVQGESLSFSRVPSRINSAAISDDGSLIALLVEPEDSGLLLLNADFDVEHERAAPVRGDVRDDRPARPISRGRNAADDSAFLHPLWPAGGKPRNDAFALASLLRARPADGHRRCRLRHDGRCGLRAGPKPGPPRSRDHLAGATCSRTSAGSPWTAKAA